MADEKVGQLVIIENRADYNCPEYGIIFAIKNDPQAKWGRKFTIKFPDNDKLFEMTYDDLRFVRDETLKNHLQPEIFQLKKRIEEWKKLKKLQTEITDSK